MLLALLSIKCIYMVATLIAMLVINIAMTKSFQCFNIPRITLIFHFFLTLILSFSSFSFFILYATIHSKDDAFVIFRDAALYNMTDAGHVWIVTEQALLANNTPTGTLGLKLNNNNETEHIRVSFISLVAAVFCCGVKISR